MSPMLQSRLLRVLQEREVRRVGENVSVYVNVRVLAACNEPLEKKIKDGTFREDLYYRLNVIAIQLPSLRERRDDIPLLIAHFLKDKVSSRTDRPFQMTRQAMDVICAHDWPGNVRELENAVERATALCEGDIIQAIDLPPSILEAVHLSGSSKDPDTAVALPVVPASALYPLRSQESTESNANPSPGPAANIALLKTFMREQEQSHLNRALQQCDGDKEKAAVLLGVSLATLYRKLSGEEKEV
jgi:DNA-binding NtrC family response regulator